MQISALYCPANRSFYILWGGIVIQSGKPAYGNLNRHQSGFTLMIEVNFMALKDFMNRLRTSEDYVEVEQPVEDKNKGQLPIEIEHLDSYTDSDRIQKKLREGTVLLVRMKDLKQKDSEELKRAVDRIKRTCLAINGDIAGLSEDWLLATPPAAKIHRENVAG